MNVDRAIEKLRFIAKKVLGEDDIWWNKEHGLKQMAEIFDLVDLYLSNGGDLPACWKKEN